MIESKSPPSAQDIAAHYDELDYFYRAVWGEHIHHGLWSSGNESLALAARQLLDLVAEKAHVTRGSQVCDAGCGYGAAARLLARERGAEVTGLTISTAQFHFAIAQNAGAQNPRFVLGDWLDHPLPEAGFDAVIAVESSEHMSDKRAFFAQARRVLRAGGRLVVCGWLAHDQASPASRRFLLAPICRESHMPALGTESEYREFLRAAGFALDSFDDLTPQVQRTWPAMVRQFAAHLRRHPRDVRFLFGQHRRNRLFARTILRILIGFKTGALRYGIFAAHKI